MCGVSPVIMLIMLFMLTEFMFGVLIVCVCCQSPSLLPVVLFVVGLAKKWPGRSP